VAISFAIYEIATPVCGLVRNDYNRLVLSVEFDFFMFPDPPDITLVAHGNIAVIAAKYHLSAFGDDIAITDSGVDSCLGTAVTHGFDFLDAIR